MVIGNQKKFSHIEWLSVTKKNSLNNVMVTGNQKENYR